MSRLAGAMAALEALGEAQVRNGMARYGIVTTERVITLLRSAFVMRK